MWVCLSDAFFSIVAHRDRPDDLLVRTRRAGEAVSPRITDFLKPDGGEPISSNPYASGFLAFGLSMPRSRSPVEGKTAATSRLTDEFGPS